MLVTHDPERTFRQISKSRAPIGKLLMDQSVVAGIGNIYRTEILWRQSIHPDTIGRAITRGQFDDLWQDARALLTIGVKKNAIITVDKPSMPAPKTRLPKRERLNIFNKKTCPRCTHEIDALSISGRRAFVCSTCQSIVKADP